MIMKKILNFDSFNESFVGGIDYDNTIVPFLQKEVGDLSKLKFIKMLMIF